MIIQDMSVHGRVAFDACCDVDAGMATALCWRYINSLLKYILIPPWFWFYFCVRSLPVWFIFLLLFNGKRGLLEPQKISVHYTWACKEVLLFFMECPQLKSEFRALFMWTLPCKIVLSIYKEEEENKPYMYFIIVEKNVKGIDFDQHYCLDGQLPF